MSEAEERERLLAELARVLGGAVSPDFFAAVGPLTGEQLAALVRWLRTLPDGIGEARLVQALHAWLGPHLSG